MTKWLKLECTCVYSISEKTYRPLLRRCYWAKVGIKYYSYWLGTGAVCWIWRHDCWPRPKAEGNISAFMFNGRLGWCKYNFKYQQYFRSSESRTILISCVVAVLFFGPVNIVIVNIRFIGLFVIKIYSIWKNIYL